MLTDFFDTCQMLDRVTREDGFGGIETVYEPGAKFAAGITTDNSTEARIAYQNGLKVMYTVVVSELTPLMQGDLIKRIKDGLTLRVTSDARDMTTPAVSSMRYMQVSAEAIRL